MQSERERLAADLARLGIRSAAVLDAIARFPRHELVPPACRDGAYENRPLPIGAGQTISQPFIVAYMTEVLALAPGEKVLEIGTGSGYQAAILALGGARVFSIEIVPELSARAASDLARLGVPNVRLRVGDGYQGWPDEAPFDGIVVTAAPRFVPPPLFAQLAEGGRLVVPVGDLGGQVLEVYKRRGERYDLVATLPVRFVPMTGEAASIGQLH